MDKTNTAHGLEKVTKRGKGCNLQKIRIFFYFGLFGVVFLFSKENRNPVVPVRVPLWPFAGFFLGRSELIDLYLQPQKI